MVGTIETHAPVLRGNLFTWRLMYARYAILISTPPSMAMRRATSEQDATSEEQLRIFRGAVYAAPT